MNARHHPMVEQTSLPLLSSQPHPWITQALAGRLQIQAVSVQAEQWLPQLQAQGPALLLVDFSEPGEGLNSVAPAESVRLVRQVLPHLPILALGQARDSRAAVAALRAGVDDFVDPDTPLDQLLLIIERLKGGQRPRSVRQGRLLAVLGARPGLGVSTLASHLARMWRQQARSHDGAGHDVALLDLGLPAADGQLYLGAEGAFSFLDACRQLRRLDQTLIQTALTRDAQGVAVLPLPHALAQLRELSLTDADRLVERLREFFDWQIADLGGLGNPEFAAHLLRQADQAWVVCDQSPASLVSTVRWMHELQERGVSLEGRASLVVNKFDPAVGVTAQDLAQRLQLPLAAVLPARSTALMSAAACGRLLCEQAPRDPYVRAVSALLPGAAAQAAAKTPAAGPQWLHKLQQWSSPMSLIKRG